MASSCSLVAGNNVLAKEPLGEQRSRAFYPSHCPADPLEMNWFALAATNAGEVASSVDAARLCKTREVSSVE